MSSFRLIKQVDMSGANIVDVNNIFSDDFDIYRVVVSDWNTDGTGGTTYYMRLLNSAGTMQINAQYEYAHRRTNSANTTISDAGQFDQTSWENPFLSAYPVPDTSSGIVDFFYPFDNDKDTIILYDTCSTNNSTVFSRTGGGRYTAPSYNSFTGFRLFPHSTSQNNTITSGQISVYGYRNA